MRAFRLRFRGSSERGAAAVEAAILVPLLLVPLIFGALELGRVFWVRSQLMNAAREGGYFAQTAPGRVVPDGSKKNTECDDPNNITHRSLAALRQGESFTSVQAGSVQVIVERVATSGIKTPVTGCSAGTFSSGEKVLVTVSGNVAPYTILGIVPLGGYTISGTQEVRVL